MLTALVLGDAACIDQDAAAALALFEPDAVAAANNMIIQWPRRLDYAVTLHVDACPDWPGIAPAICQRVAAGRNRPEVWSYKASSRVDRHTSEWGGSTGLHCVKVLLEEGFDRIVLAGVPLTAEQAHFYTPRKWAEAPRYRNGWIKHLKEIEPFVRSMSGWTQEILGPPTAEWLGAAQKS